MAEVTEQMQMRSSRRAKILAFFTLHLGERFFTNDLHWRFGSGFRARVSEINRGDAYRIYIRNQTSIERDEHGQRCETSVYWGELRSPAEPRSMREPRPTDEVKPL